MKKLMIMAMLACAPAAAYSAASNPALNVVELTVAGSAIDEPDTEGVAMKIATVDKRKSHKHEILYADPTIYAEDGKFYMSGTRSFGPEGFTLLESSDLRNWDYARKDSLILRKGNQTFGTQWFWAPQIFKEQDKYLFAYVANERCAVATATNLTDVYTQSTVEAVDNTEGNIDPFIFKDDDGKYYFYHVRFGGGNFLWVAEFDPTTCKLVPGTLKKCFSNTQAWENTNAYPSSPIMEGPTVIKIDDLYYLFYSANHYLSPDYAVGYATAPSPTGPWTKNPGNPIIHQSMVGERGPGHGDVFFDNEGNMRYVYHVHNSQTTANPRRTRILTLNVDKSQGAPYNITADLSSVIIPTEGYGSGAFTCYARVKPGTLTLTGHNTYGETVYYGQKDGALAQDGEPITIDQEGVMRIDADLYAGTVTFTPVQSVEVKGSVASEGTTISYAGNGVWSSEVNLDKSTDGGEYVNRNIYFTLTDDAEHTIKRVSGTNRIGFVADGFTGENIRINQGKYTISLDFNNLTYDISGEVDPHRISVFGSSVANGQGATNFKGYAYMFGEQLKERYADGDSEYPFYTTGVSIGGNTTTALMNRFDDLIRDNGQYVIFGLSLGNEGIHGASNPRTVYNQFRDNMLTLIAQAREAGKIPVVMNNYTRGDYTPTDYTYIQQMNVLIQEWDVPSVNTLGSIDDGAGHWASGFIADDFHPNTNGHKEFSYAFVPSMFDAIAEGKPLPERDITGSYILSDGATMTFAPEGPTTHSFTLSLLVKGNESGHLLTFDYGTNRNKFSGSLGVNADGTLTYKSNKADETTEAALLANDKTHFVTLTHYYAWGCTMVYVDNKPYITVSEKLNPLKFVIGDPDENAAPRTIGEVAFWRAGMNAREIISHGAKRMLKSSLEIYTPFTEETNAAIAAAQEEEPVLLPNRAQSLNAIIFNQPKEGSSVEAATADATAAVPVGYFAPDGRAVAPAEAHDGIYLVRYSDGTTRKVKL